MSKEIEVPVLIVGGGPVGMMLALNLAALGTRSILINSALKPRWHPKGSTQNSRTMEHYRRLGIVDSIRSTGLPKDLPTDVTYYTRLAGYELSRLRMPSERDKLAARDRAPADDQVVEPIFRCNQMHAEARIFEHVVACPLIDCRYGWDCVAWSEQPDGVTAEIVEFATGKRETIRGAYLAGCDGGHGIVRRQLGVGYLGETPTIQPYLGGPMVSTYLRAPDLVSVAGTACWQYWIVNHDVRANIVAVDGKSEFLFSTRLDRPDQTPLVYSQQREECPVVDTARVLKSAHDCVDERSMRNRLATRSPSCVTCNSSMLWAALAASVCGSSSC